MTETAATLDNLTLARKEGWQKFVNTPYVFHRRR